MHPACRPSRNSPRLGRPTHVKDLKPTLEVAVDPADREHFAVNEHDLVFHPNLVGKRAFRNADAGKVTRVQRIGDIDYTRAVGRLHMTYEGDVVAHHDLPPTRQIMKSDDLDAICDCHGIFAPKRHGRGSYCAECSSTIRSTSTRSLSLLGQGLLFRSQPAPALHDGTQRRDQPSDLRYTERQCSAQGGRETSNPPTL